QETRLYDPDKGETRPMRSKEEANDYRYFPDPDLLPLVLSDAFIEEVRTTLPELPDQKAARFASGYGLSPYDAGVLTASRELAAYYEEVVRELEGEPKLAANWVMGELAAALNRENLEVGSGRLPAARLAGLLDRLGDHPIADGPTYGRGEYRAAGPDASIRALRDDVLQKVVSGGAKIVDVRSPKEYAGELLAPENLPQEGAQRGGHIPGAQNVPWATAVAEDGRFKTADELRTIYGGKGIDLAGPPVSRPSSSSALFGHGSLVASGAARILSRVGRLARERPRRAARVAGELRRPRSSAIIRPWTTSASGRRWCARSSAWA